MSSQARQKNKGDGKELPKWFNDPEANFYDILEVNPHTPLIEIKKAYRILSKMWHPDLNPGDDNAERVQQKISEAYHVLSDSAKKAAYDREKMFVEEGGVEPIDFGTEGDEIAQERWEMCTAGDMPYWGSKAYRKMWSDLVGAKNKEKQEEASALACRRAVAMGGVSRV